MNLVTFYIPTEHGRSLCTQLKFLQPSVKFLFFTSKKEAEKSNDIIDTNILCLTGVVPLPDIIKDMESLEHIIFFGNTDVLAVHTGYLSSLSHRGITISSIHNCIWSKNTFYHNNPGFIQLIHNSYVIPDPLKLHTLFPIRSKQKHTFFSGESTILYQLKNKLIDIQFSEYIEEADYFIFSKPIYQDALIALAIAQQITVFAYEHPMLRELYGDLIYYYQDVNDIIDIVTKTKNKNSDEENAMYIRAKRSETVIAMEWNKILFNDNLDYVVTRKSKAKAKVLM